MAEETAQQYRERVARAGGFGRAKKMTAKQRSDAAKKAVEARWAEHKRIMKQSDKNLAKLEKQADRIVEKSEDLVKLNRSHKRKKADK